MAHRARRGRPAGAAALARRLVRRVRVPRGSGGLALADEPDCTAVFAANDQMALGLLRAFHEKGKVVPRDVSVVGFDDIPDSGSFVPPPTTVRQDFTEVGRRCVERVLRQVRNEPVEPGTTLVPTRLVLRDSTSAPSA